MGSLRDDQSTPRDVQRTGGPSGSSNAKVTRRTIFRFAAQLAAGLLMAGRGEGSPPPPQNSSSGGRGVGRFPGKREVSLLAGRPPQPENPLPPFRHDLSPNQALFV